MVVVVTSAQLSKLHGTGNDFLVTTAVLDARDAVALCDRFTGIGADGLLLLGPGRDGADATMTLYNADGSVAEMSGNGIRCLAWLARKEGFGTPDRLVVDTGGGRRVVDLELDARGMVTHATCDMGAVTFVPSEIPIEPASATDLPVDLDGVDVVADAAGMGNPHLVVFVDDPGLVDVARHGALLETDERFPNRINVEFVHVEGRHGLRLRVWERGVGETQSCGTGACAAAAVAHRRDLVDAQVLVSVPGGVVTVELTDTIRLGGPVTHVFDLPIDLDEWRTR
ncbi:MAG: diaminopimelate epimerase [Acidimicrobiia bacterium]